MRARRLAPAVLVLVLVPLPAGSALAAPLPAGALNAAGCVANPAAAAAAGCAPGHVTLDGIRGLALSPDGLQLYVTAYSDEGPPPATGSLVTYARDPVTGALTRTACRDRAMSAGCIADPRVGEPNSLAIAPDGTDVYSADSSRGLLHYRRGSDGALTAQPCYEPPPDDDPACTLVAKGLVTTTGVALSRDGRYVYVTGYSNNSVAVFQRNTATGTLAFVECEAAPDPAFPNDCGSGPGGSLLSQATDVALSPDGAHVYVSARGSSVVSFVRNAADGKLSAPQSESSSDYLQGAQTIAVAPGGEAVYVGLFDGDGLTTLSRDAGTGAPSLLGCLRKVASASCAASPGVDAVFDVDFSADGGVLYAAARNGSMLASFRRGTGGSLSLISCAHAPAAAAAGCDHSVSGLEDTQALAVTQDARFVYAGGSIALATLTPEHAPTCAPLARAVANGRATEFDVSCSDADGQPVSHALGSQPANGTATLVDASAGRIRYLPRPGFAGVDTLTFTASDGTNSSAPATATLAVPADASPPRIKIITKRVRLTRRGLARVRLSCAAGEPAGCNGKLSARSARKLATGSATDAARRFLRLGSRRFRIPEGERRTVTIRVRRGARRAISVSGRLKARFTAQARDPSGNAGRTRRRVLVLAPRRH